MLEILEPALQRQPGKLYRNRKPKPWIDMTPMVDLGFLLITFFIFSATISTPSVTNLYMPGDSVTEPPTLSDKLALTLLLNDENRIFYYEGRWEEALAAQYVFETGYSTSKGIGAVIRKKKRQAAATKNYSADKKGIMLVIKPTQSATYKNFIDALDEVLINDVKRYVIVDPSAAEQDYVSSKKSGIQFQ